MNTPIDCMLLVDDSKSNNFLNRKILEKTGKVHRIYEALNGLEALDFLLKKGKFEGNECKANVILLDLNMPKMNGFEFLETYNNLNLKDQSDTVIVILSTSNWDKDISRAKENPLVQDYIEKPLDNEKIKKIYQQYMDRKLLLK